MFRFVLISFFFLLSPTQSSAATPIQNIIDAPVPIRSDGGRFSIEEVRAAIIKGSQSRLWTPVVAGAESIRAELNVKNKHFAVVEIMFSETAYSIIYVSSENLDYNAVRDTIHRNYNKWVIQLSTMINQQFQSLESDSMITDSPRIESEAANTDIFDELLKLDDLRDRGILTDEEFESEKRKLLKRN